VAADSADEREIKEEPKRTFRAGANLSFSRFQIGNFKFQIINS
jgi:hypothetical protein